ncbi:hypothetical protein LINGRAHAP2_LOCUS26936 [Linum grandiflorum]
MPLPWKKSKVATISRLVTDLHHHSPNRGNSLVVQTGFPASLVDLFYKNRDRLKKKKKPSSRKTKANRHQSDEDDEIVISDPVLADPIDGGAESSGGHSGIDEIQEVVEDERVQVQIRKDRTRKRIMRKLVPKKLRHRTKCAAFGGDKELGELGKTETLEGNRNQNRKGKLLLISDVLETRLSFECEDGILIEDDDDDGESCLTSGELKKSELDTTNSRRIGSNSGCLILLLAVLVGLAGGRFLALLLTVLACLMIKFAGRRRSLSPR